MITALSSPNPTKPVFPTDTKAPSLLTCSPYPDTERAVGSLEISTVYIYKEGSEYTYSLPCYSIVLYPTAVT